MTTRSTIGEKSPDGGKKRRGSHLLTTAVLLLGVLSIAMLGWTDRITRRSEIAFYLDDAIMELQISVALSHVFLEEVYHGNRQEQATAAQSHHDRAAELCEVLLNGGASEDGQIWLYLEEPRLRTEVAAIKGMLSELQTIVRDHYHGPGQDAFPLYWDERHDEVISALLEKAASVERGIEERGIQDLAASRRLYYWILFAWSTLVVASFTGLYNRERHRRAAEIGLQEANVQLERGTEELRRHREHLTKLVEERTAGLQSANLELRKEVVERRETEEALRKSEERYRMLVETMNEGLTIFDDKGEIAYVNEEFCSMLGYSRGEILGRSWTDFLISEDDRKPAAERLREIRPKEHNRFEVAFRRKDGQTISTVVSPKEIRNASGKAVGCFAVITDMTEKISLQAKSMRAAHLASIGEMAAGVAHEINNPANGIVNYARILLDQSDAASREHDIAERIHQESRRIAEIVKALLLFARGGKAEKTRVDLKEILSNAWSLTDSQLRNDGIEVKTSIASDLPKLIADPQEIQQVIMNILSNARYALNEKYPRKHEEKILEISAQKTIVEGSPYVRLAFRDRGIGIPAAIIHKIQEPFFSTKPRGKGTGLGLSISNGIINEHGGKLSVESVEGEFTKVVVELPVRGGDDGKSPGN